MAITRGVVVSQGRCGKERYIGGGSSTCWCIVAGVCGCVCMKRWYGLWGYGMSVSRGIVAGIIIIIVITIGGVI